jgi:hypothetical protein
MGGVAGALAGRHGRKVKSGRLRGVRLIFEGLTSRPGVRCGSPSRGGRGRPEPAAHSRSRKPSATVLGLPVARARPGNVPGAVVGVVSVKGGGLPAERGELARAGDRDDAGGLAPLVVRVRPALVQAMLGAPRDVDRAWVLALLVAGERFADARLMRPQTYASSATAATSAAPLASRAVASGHISHVHPRAWLGSDAGSAASGRHHPQRWTAGPGCGEPLPACGSTIGTVPCSIPHAQRQRRASRALDAMLTSDPFR